MTVIFWLLALAQIVNFEERCDRLKTFYNRRTWHP